MSSPPLDSESNTPKYTKGEKCIFIHIVLSLALIIILCIIYYIHLTLGSHPKDDLLTIPRSYQEDPRQTHLKEYVGMVYLNTTTTKNICNTLLLHERWSLAPAQCTIMRTEPAMADHLVYWKIKYKVHKQDIHIDIKRTLIHPGFNRGNYQNNIGLIEHVEPIKSKYYIVPNYMPLNDKMFQKYYEKMFLVNWERDLLNKGAVVNSVSPINSSVCLNYATYVVETLRNYEFCVNYTSIASRKTLDHGAMFVMNSQIIGFFSWGDTNGYDTISLKDYFKYLDGNKEKRPLI